MRQEQAEIIAIQALGWLAAQEDLLSVFLGSTGATVEDIKTSATDPEFLGSVLDFLLLDDAYVTGFCDAQGHAYELPMQARQHLPGAMVHWT